MLHRTSRLTRCQALTIALMVFGLILVVAPAIADAKTKVPTAKQLYKKGEPKLLKYAEREAAKLGFTGKYTGMHYLCSTICKGKKPYVKKNVRSTCGFVDHTYEDGPTHPKTGTPYFYRDFKVTGKFKKKGGKRVLVVKVTMMPDGESCFSHL